VLVDTSLSNDVAVSEPGEGNGASPENGAETPTDAGVLANLPRTRPQRATARRAAARSANAAEQPTSPNGNGSAPRSAPRKAAAKRAAPAKPKPARAKTARPKVTRAGKTEEVPRQGYESVEERATGPVQPPGGTELVGTAAEIVSEIAKAGISGGERVLRDVLSRLGL
jgi:hypothetical protein